MLRSIYRKFGIVKKIFSSGNGCWWQIFMSSVDVIFFPRVYNNCFGKLDNHTCESHPFWSMKFIPTLPSSAWQKVCIAVDELTGLIFPWCWMYRSFAAWRIKHQLVHLWNVILSCCTHFLRVPHLTYQRMACIYIIQETSCQDSLGAMKCLQPYHVFSRKISSGTYQIFVIYILNPILKKQTQGEISPPYHGSC